MDQRCGRHGIPESWRRFLVRMGLCCLLPILALPPARAASPPQDVAAPPVWKFTGITSVANWPNAGAERGVVNERGGEVELAIRGTRQYYCPPTGGEHVLFKWSFRRDITTLRPGDDIEVEMHIQPMSHDNICTGQLENACELGALTSNSAGYSPEEGPYYEDRIIFKAGSDAAGGDRQPSRRDAVAVLRVNTSPLTDKHKIRFSIRLGGPCDHPEPWTCGSITYRYSYELATAEPGPGPGPGGGGGETPNACGFFLGSGIYDKWMQLGGERGVMKCATSGESEAGRSPFGTTGRYASFSAPPEGGAIHWHRNGKYAGRSFETHGAIHRLWGSLGGSMSWLGFPISDEYDVPGGRRSDFEGGYILWDARTGRAQALRYEKHGLE